MNKRTIFILGIGSDIGKELASRYVSEGNTTIIGTFRRKSMVRDILDNKSIKLFKCDLLNKAEIKDVAVRYGRMRKRWDIFISCVGVMEPIGKFFKTKFDQWEDSLVANSIGQLRFLYNIYPYRNKNKVPSVIYFAGGGTNSAMSNYSAYCASKIILIKTCELLDDENRDLNVFIVGPGWVRTKILNQTLRNAKAAGEAYKRTEAFLKSGRSGTSYEDIYDCINWCVAQGKRVVGGRNISVVHDYWRSGGKKLASQLLDDSNKFKLRRFKNTR